MMRPRPMGLYMRVADIAAAAAAAAACCSRLHAPGPPIIMPGCIMEGGEGAERKGNMGMGMSP